MSFSSHPVPKVFTKGIAAVTFLIVASAQVAAAGGGAAPAFDYDSLTLVDAVDCATDTEHDFVEYPSGISSVSTILGEAVRTLSSDSEVMNYFGYRLGKGKGLQADKGYILRVIYPEDAPRSVFIANRGCETTRGFHTGRTTGDGLKAPYIINNCESLELPLTGEYESWDMLFYLHERYPGLKQPRDTEFDRDQEPDDGFLVLCLQLSEENDPLSEGVAVKRIELYEAPPLEEMVQPLAQLPAGLPRRHLFWREEMADTVIYSTERAKRGFDDDMSWYEQKFRLMQFLGMRTFAKDLLEFGANQGWDSSKFGGGSWVHQSKSPQRWSRIVRRCGELGFELLPYYEYSGSKGSKGYGFERRARPLARDDTKYTQIGWTEAANVDVTDPDTYEDFRKMLEITVADEHENADFAGIWIRTRVSDIPISFADATLARFEAETGSKDVTRARLRAEPGLYDTYVDWWYGKRREFLEKVCNYLRTSAHDGMEVIFTSDCSEPGKARAAGMNPKGLIAEDPTKWDDTGVTVSSLATALSQNWQLRTLTSPWNTWGTYEWQHSVPHPDPSRYKDADGIFMTHTVNHAYTINDAVCDAFRAKDGYAAIRHYSLNEDATTVGEDKRVAGYFVADVDYAGPFVMLPEALAFAHGDPKYFGYLASNNYNRGNPQYVRSFNANFLALPALPSVVDSRYSTDSDLVVRSIATDSNGVYLGAVHLGRHKATLDLVLPEAGILKDAVSGAVLETTNNRYSMEMQPCELRAFRFFPNSANTPPEIVIDDEIVLEWWHVLTTRCAWKVVELTPIAIDHEQDPLGSISWTALGDNADQVRIKCPQKLHTKIAFKQPGSYVVRLSVSDGSAESHQDVKVTVETRRHQIVLDPSMADYSGTNIVDSGLFNNQDEAGDPPNGDLGTTWKTQGASMYPVSFPLDMGQVYQLSEIWVLDSNGVGTFRIHAGSETEGWTEIVDMQTDSYNVWKRLDVDVETRYLKIERVDGGATVGELILYGRGGGFSSR